jgi:S1-C subfamily serine protease
VSIAVGVMSRRRYAGLVVVLVAGLALSACSRERGPAGRPMASATVSATVSTEDLRGIVREEIEAALAEREAQQPPRCTSALSVARARPAVVKVETRLPGTLVVTSAGTGFVALAGGLVVTASHVVDDEREIVLTLVDGRRVGAKLIARDAAADLALLRAADPHLTPVRWADPSAIALGEETVVIGHALGRDRAIVTAGVLSRRVRAADNRGVELLETDANADPGNSGGPLLTACGEALGVVTRIDRTTVFTTIATGVSTVLPFIAREAE